MVEAGRSNSRGKHRSIDPCFDNSPYLSSPIRPIPSTTSGGAGKNHRAQSSSNGKGQAQSQEDTNDGIAPLRDITVSSKSPTSLLRSTSRSRSAGRQRDDDDGCSLADSTICTTRTATKGNAASRKSPYLMGAGATNTNSGGRSTSAKRVGRGATTATSKPTAKKKPLPKLLLMPDEVDEMLLQFKQRQHEEGKLLLNNTGDDAAAAAGDAGDDADEEYSSDEEDDSSSSVSSSSSEE